MGMIGYYYALEDAQIKQLADGEIVLEQLDPADSDVLNISKSWQSIHYLLCGDIDEGEPPFGYVVPMLDDHILDFGEFGAFYIHHEHVVEGYNALSTLSKNDVFERYDFDAMLQDDIYPIVSDGDKDEFFDYLFTYLKEIKFFYEKAASKGKGIIFYIL